MLNVVLQHLVYALTTQERCKTHKIKNTRTVARNLLSMLLSYYERIFTNN